MLEIIKKYLLGILGELDDIRAYDKAKSEPSSSISLDEAIKMLYREQA